MRIFGKAIPVGALLALAISVSAQAGVRDAAACTVSGVATTTPSVKNTGGAGTFTFQSPAPGSPLNLNCVVTSDNGTTADPKQEVDVQQLSATSGGTFSNEVCGTGTAEGSNLAPTVVARFGPNNLSGAWAGASFNYHISFVGGVGALVFIEPSQVSGAGPIVITPLFNSPSEPGVGPTATCTTLFEVNGALAGVLTPSDISDSDLGPLHTDLIQDGGGGVPGTDPEPNPPSTYPSQFCRQQTGATVLANDGLFSDGQGNSVAHYSAAMWQPPSTTRTDLCFRVQKNPTTGVGGMLEVDTGSPGSLPTVTTPATDAGCDIYPIDRQAPPVLRVGVTSSPSANPMLVCLNLNGTMQQVRIDRGGSGTQPQVCWTSDPGPNPRTCLS